MGLIIAIIIGAIAGWLAGQIVKGHGQGTLMNIIVGVVGAVIASLLFPALGWNLGAAPATGAKGEPPRPARHGAIRSAASVPRHDREASRR